MTRALKVIAFADEHISEQNSIIKSKCSFMRKLGYPERIVFLGKLANVCGMQARVAEVPTHALNKFSRDRNLVYKGPAA